MKYNYVTPRVTGEKDIEDSTLNECIQTIFSSDSEKLFIKWHGIYIPLDYKYTISIVCEDIIYMLEELIKHESGNLRIDWPSNDFRCDWNVVWQGNSIIIESKWFSILGDSQFLLEDLLNKLGVLTVNKSQFIYEWSKLFGKIIEAIEQCNYTEKEIADICKLKSIYAKSKKVLPSEQETKKLVHNLRKITNRKEFICFINYLNEDFLNNKDEWSNINISDFLESLSAWVSDMDGFYENANLEVPENLNWQFFADALHAVKYYE